MDGVKFVGLFVFVFMILPGLASADGGHNDEITEGKSIVEQGIACSQLNDEQLEAVGEYFMEQMHPGAAHEMMDNMMGGEGSESLRRVHIAMAQRLYCNESVYVGYGMGPGMMGYGGGWMMGGYPLGYNYGNYWYWSIFWVLIYVVIIFLAVWIVYRIMIKKGTSSETPLSILKKRYASGEITRQHYKKLKNELKAHNNEH